MPYQKFLLVLCMGFLSFIDFDKKKITVYMIGDSTMAIKEVKTWPETVWGMPVTVKK